MNACENVLPLVGVGVGVGVFVGVGVGVGVGVFVGVGVGVGVGKVTHFSSQVIPPLFTTETSFPLESEVGELPSVNNNKLVPEIDVTGY